MKRLSSLIGAIAIAGSAALVGVGSAGAGASVSISLDACTRPVGASTGVTWSGYKTGSLVIDYKQARTSSRSSSSLRSATVVVNPASSAGSMTVATPSRALSGNWYVHEVTLYRGSRGSGSHVEKRFDCGSTPPSTTTTTSTTSTTTPAPTTTTPPPPAGIGWTSRTSAAANSWQSVAYGTPGGIGIFVAVSASGTGNRVMTSPDGTTWTIRSSAADYSWRSVAYGTPGGNPLFVAVTSSSTSAGNQVMTSPDGITWTLRSTPTPGGQWQSVTYGNGKFVAVSDFELNAGLNGRSMTSADGITWTLHDAPDDSTWRSVTYGEPGGNPLFVAVAYDYVNAVNVVMTSPDGETWTARTGFPNNEWRSVTWGDGRFVAVSITGINVSPVAPGRVMSSLDGITWTLVDPPVDSDGPTFWETSSWTSVTYGAGLYVAVGYGGSGQRVMTSPDGASWTLQNSAADNTWNSVTYGGGTFVAVASGCPAGGICTDNLVMTSP